MIHKIASSFIFDAIYADRVIYCINKRLESVLGERVVSLFPDNGYNDLFYFASKKYRGQVTYGPHVDIYLHRRDEVGGCGVVYNGSSGRWRLWGTCRPKSKSLKQVLRAEDKRGRTRKVEIVMSPDDYSGRGEPEFKEKYHSKIPPKTPPKMKKLKKQVKK